MSPVFDAAWRVRSAIRQKRFRAWFKAKGLLSFSKPSRHVLR